MKTMGTLVMTTSVILFYLIFFQLAPYVTGLLPDSGWAPILKLIVYLVIAWFGGIAIPLCLLLLGAYIFVRGL